MYAYYSLDLNDRVSVKTVGCLIPGRHAWCRVQEKFRKVIESAKDLSWAVVVLGGAGYGIFPEAIPAHSRADMGIQGEGEETFRLLSTTWIKALCIPDPR